MMLNDFFPPNLYQGGSPFYNEQTGRYTTLSPKNRPPVNKMAEMPVINSPLPISSAEQTPIYRNDWLNGVGNQNDPINPTYGNVTSQIISGSKNPMSELSTFTELLNMMRKKPYELY